MSGLAGFGACGPWSVDIDDDDRSSGIVEWSVTLTHPTMTLQSTIQRLDMLQGLVEFLAAKEKRGAFQLETADRHEVSIVSDEDWLAIKAASTRGRLGDSRTWLLECTFDASTANELAIAIGQAITDARN